MIKKLIIVFIAVFAIKSYAQQGTASPYSFYGIGTLKFKGTVENRSMGGLSIFSDSIHINLRNPAFYTGKNIRRYNNESRPVKFTVGGSYNSLNLIAANGEEQASSTTFDYLALNVPLGKFGFGFGLLPFTSVGYKLESLNTAGDPANRYSGEGGLNKAFIGFAYQLTNNFRIGIDGQYNFGNVQNNAIAFIYDSQGNPVQFQTREDNRSDLSGLNFDVGLAYNAKINDKYEVMASVAYTPKSNLTSNNTRSLSSVVINAITGSEFVVSTIDQDLSLNNLEKTDLTLPSRFSFGAGIGKPLKWFVGAEYTKVNTSQFSNPIITNSSTTFEDASSFSFGGFFIPDYNSFSSYFKRVVYRAGVRFEGTGLNINNESINEFGISFGAGLPVGGAFSNANIGFEFGQRGTTNQNLIQENFFTLSISLSLNDRWFQKRKFN
ncbi:hypothetical protein RM697_07550 [Ichthyenterobacterium sp. W332]|uniref:Long-subunit fatty acid transport protein n=1 Tax=Microcosmobacter mediterraneus TaxID=3075607 RepID=A0ABU2YKZ5_9FLAO|nr:hypothetical protein [Ichthyenterobacterium sp. W332]MDT0558495.1 hypothetical protein [Ichthyenterobacterium sp. W332]